jgi:hypothetical protein
MAIWIEETRYNPLCDADEESSSDMLSKELNTDNDDEIWKLKKKLRVKNRKVRVRAKQVLLRVGGREDVTMGDDACGEIIPPNKEIGPSKRQESTWGDKTYRETILEKFCARQKHCNR